MSWHQGAWCFSSPFNRTVLFPSNGRYSLRAKGPNKHKNLFCSGIASEQRPNRRGDYLECIYLSIYDRLHFWVHLPYLVRSCTKQKSSVHGFTVLATDIMYSGSWECINLTLDLQVSIAIPPHACYSNNKQPYYCTWYYYKTTNITVRFTTMPVQHLWLSKKLQHGSN